MNEEIICPACQKPIYINAFEFYGFCSVERNNCGYLFWIIFSKNMGINSFELRICDMRIFYRETVACHSIKIFKENYTQIFYESDIYLDPFNIKE
jgi:hypothetical protein